MNSSHFKLVRATLVSFLLASIAAVVSVAQSPHSDHGVPVAENWKSAVADTDNGGASDQATGMRNARATLFDDRTGLRKPLDSTEPKDATRGWSNNPPNWVRMSPMPIEESDLVAIGKVASFQPYLSNDHTHLYTELSITIEKVIKDTTHKTGQGNTISILKGGGNLRLPNGTVIKEAFAPSNERLELGSRYVLFLRYDSNFDYYQANKTWELEDNRVIPTSRTDIRDAEQGKSAYSKMTEAEFLEVLGKQVTAGENPGSLV